MRRSDNDGDDKGQRSCPRHASGTLSGTSTKRRSPRVAGDVTDCVVQDERRGGEVGFNQKSAGDRDDVWLLGWALVPAKGQAAWQQALGAIQVGR